MEDEKDNKKDPDKLFEITEEPDHNNSEIYFVLKIVVTQEMRDRISDFDKNRKEKQKKIDAEERSPDIIAIKQKLEVYKHLNPKVLDQERRKNGEYAKTIAQWQKFQSHKQKFSFPLFEKFENRGKYSSIKFTYNPQNNQLIIRINKNYFLNELNLSRKDLFNIAISFSRTWDNDFHGLIRVLWRLYTEQHKPVTYNLIIKAMDLISVTFDIVYAEKRTYRYRYSPFEFRNSPTFKDDNQLTGYYQSLSLISEITTTKIPVVDNDFYTAARLFMLDDLTDSNLFYKIFNRTYLFFQIYSISRGTYTGSETDDFAKKCLGQFYFSTTRLKKFIFTWSFKQFRRPIPRQKKSKENDLEPRQIVLNLPFYLGDSRDMKQNQSLTEPAYRMRMQILQRTISSSFKEEKDRDRTITPIVKQQLYVRIRDWYLLIKQWISAREKSCFQREKQSIIRVRQEKQYRSSDYDDYQLPVQFSSRERFEKFFIGLLMVVSTVLDRNYFTLAEDKEKKREQPKIITLQTQQSSYTHNKKTHICHYHCFKLYFRHCYNTGMFQFTSREEEKQMLFAHLNNKFPDYKLKFGQWRLQKINKYKRKINLKNADNKNNNNTEDTMPEQLQLQNFLQIFKTYISILLKHFPLRLIYKDILNFVEQISKTCYHPLEDSNLATTNGYEIVMKAIIQSFLNYFYYCQIKEKQQKLRREKEQRQDLSNLVNSISNNNSNLQIIETKAPEVDKAKLDKYQDTFGRVVLIKILTKGDVGFLMEQKLTFQVTFRVMELKQVWLTRIKDCYIVLRVFQDRIEFQKEYTLVYVIKGDFKNKKIIDEHAIKLGLDACMSEHKIQTAL